MADIEDIRNYCIQKEDVSESFPFDETTLVLKTCNKMFALLSLNPPFSINVKCDPDLAIQLRESYEFVIPGYHMNKKHWNTIYLDDAPIDLVHEWIDHSYNLIVSKHGKKRLK